VCVATRPCPPVASLAMDSYFNSSANYGVAPHTLGRSYLFGDSTAGTASHDAAAGLHRQAGEGLQQNSEATGLASSFTTDPYFTPQGLRRVHQHLDFDLHSSSGPALAVCSPFSTSSSFLACGGEGSINVFRAAVEKDEESWHFDPIAHIPHNTHLRALSWSPRSQETGVVIVSFCAAGGDKKLRFYQVPAGDEGNTSPVLLCGHSQHINDCAAHPHPQVSHVVASTGDDHTCRLWDIEKKAEFASTRLRTAGIAVGWSAETHNQFFVAQAGGRIKIIDLRAMVIIRSLTVDGGVSLLDADWSLINPRRIGAISGGRWWVWDLSLSTGVPETGVTRFEAGTRFQ